MADFTAEEDAYSTKSGGASLDATRDSGTSYTMTMTGYGGPVTVMYIGPRPISFVGYYSINRGHLFFDLSGASGTITSATLKLYAYSGDTGGDVNNGHKFYVVGHDYGGSLNSAADDVNPTNNTAGDWTSTSVPTYSDEITVDGVAEGDEVGVTMNATALTAINNAVGSGDFDVGLVSNHDYKDDFTLSPTPVNGFSYTGVHFCTVNHATSGYRPVLTLNTGAAEVIIPARLTLKSGTMNLKGGTVVIK